MGNKEAKKILSLYKNLSFLDKLHIYIRLRRLDFSLIEKYVPKQGTILDFGCGHGFFSLYLQGTSRNRTIIGTDIAEKKIRIASESVHTKKVIFACDKDAKFLDKKAEYNCIIALSVLYLLKKEDQEDIITKISLSLKKGGVFILYELDATYKFLTFITRLRENIMVNVFGLTSGNTVLIRPKEYWMKLLKRNFTQTESINFKKNGFHVLYVSKK